MRKYILILFGDFKSDELTKEVAMNLTPLVDSPHLKFQRTMGSIIFHFASEVSQEEINDYVWGTLIDVTNSFILSEYTDKMTLNFPEDVKKHLFDLEKNSEDLYINMSINSSVKREMNHDEDEFVALLLEQIKDKVKKPSLDFILDKINSEGLQSLTPFKKEILDSYSKN